MKEVKIQIPDNCELVKDGDSYVVREKQNPPRTWEEFCKRYPVKKGESYTGTDGQIHIVDIDLSVREHRNWCYSKEEAEAFLALMQLRQLRKAWVGDWEQPDNKSEIGFIAYNIISKDVVADFNELWGNISLSFPTKKMAEDFLSCFKGLCETAKMLL